MNKIQKKNILKNFVPNLFEPKQNCCGNFENIQMYANSFLYQCLTFYLRKKTISCVKAFTALGRFSILKV